MSYIGNQVTTVPHIIDTFTGTGTATSFGPMTRAPAGTAAIAVFITGSYQIPGVDYTLNGNFINFTSAPFNLATIVVHHLGNGTTTQVPSDGSVTGTKLAINSVRGNNIVAGQITGNLIGIGAVSGNQIGVGAVSGNQIGTGAISANNFAGGGITSNVLASNLSISLTRALESANIIASAAGGTVNIDVANNVVYYFAANTTSDITFNLRANTQNTFDSITSTGQTTTVAMIVRHGTTRHKASLAIDGTLISTGATPFASGTSGNAVFYTANVRPTQASISSAELNVFGYTVFKTAANSYTVIASNTLSSLG
jgi:hypothetical protein